MGKMLDKHNAKVIEKEINKLNRELKIREAQTSLRAFIEFIMYDPDAPDDAERSKFQCKPHHQVIIDLFEDVEAGRNLRAAISVAPQHGKNLAHDTPVFTPRGWRKHGDLKPGDRVFGSGGKPIKVVAVSADEMVSCELVTTHGDRIKCHLKHEWTVWDGQKHRFRTMETQQMIDEGVHLKCGRNRFTLPTRPVLDMPDIALPMDPYVFGAWLGDGRSTGACISHAANDVAVINEIAARGYVASAQCVHKDTGVITTYFRDGFHASLKNFGVFNNKHIPAVYLTSSIRQRLELLAGLIDTDGCVQKKFRRVCFSNTNLDLINQAADLVRSFGWRATIAEFSPLVSSSGIVGKKVVYQLTFSPDMDIPTKLPRKKITAWKVVRRRDTILDITKCAPEPGRCIQVEAKDGIYLAGRLMTPTHNSTITSLYGIAWALARNPHMNIILGTYSEDRAWKVGEQVRGIMQSVRFKAIFPSFELRKGSKAKDYLGTKEGGGVLFRGRGSATTGNPCDLFIIDDPIKDNIEAQSPAVRGQTWDWYCAVVFSRLHTTSRILLVHTRWVEDDLIGKVCDPMHSEYDAESADKWTYINLPAIIEDQALADAMGLTVGQPLWAERFSLALLNEAKKQNPETFSALYMGKPVPDEGNFFKQEMIVEYTPRQLPEELKYYATSDHAFKAKATGDFTVLLIWGVDHVGNIWLVDCVWKKMEPLECVEKMCDLMLKWNPITWWTGRDHIVGVLGPFLKKRMQERKCFRTWIQDVSEKGDKQQKAQAIRGRMGQGMVKFPLQAPWFAKAKLEILKFDKAGHDDFVDAISLIGRVLDTLYGAAGPTVAKKDEMPKTGTLAWVRYAADKEKLLNKINKAWVGW